MFRLPLSRLGPNIPEWLAIVAAIIGILAGSLQALISPHPDQWPAFALFWGGIWVVAFPIAVLLKWWRIERQLATYRRMNAHRGMINGVLSSRIFGWIT